MVQQENENNMEELAAIDDIEQLITTGIDHEIPIKVSYQGTEFSVLIHPLSNSTINTINNLYLKNKESVELNLCLKGMVKKDGGSFKKDELLRLPSGVVTSIATEISVISGIGQTDADQNEIIKQIMGF